MFLNKMLCSMFSVFDPGCTLLNNYFQFKWVVILMYIVFVNWQFFFLPSGPSMFLNALSKGFISMIKNSFKNEFKKTVLILMGLFIFIFICGEFGMIPCVFTCTSHLVINMALSLPLWLGGTIYMFINSLKKALSHFVPTGCPFALIFFLVIVETLSNIIRPFSLCVRLMSNMMAGHIIIALISSSVNLMLIIIPFGVVIQGFLLMFEMGVSFVQAYVFSNLVSMYWQENSI